MDEACECACLCAWCGLKPLQKEESHVKANLEVASSQFFVNPFQSLSSKGKNKNATTKGMTVPSVLPSFTPEKHCQKLPHKHTHKYTHTYTQAAHMLAAQVQNLCLAFRRLLLRSVYPEGPAGGGAVDMFDLGKLPPRPTKQDSPPLFHNSTEPFLLAWQAHSRSLPFIMCSARGLQN